MLAMLVFAAGASAQDGLTVQRQRLADARRSAIAATARAAELERAANDERDAATQARKREAAVAARIGRAEADIEAAEARVAIVAQLLTDQRARLAQRQRPVARLLAALQSLARRPTAVAIAQPGSVEDLVRVRAVLGTTLPVVRQRTAAIRADLDATRALRASALLAARSLSQGRGDLVRERAALAALQVEHARRATDLGRSAMTEADRALALGEDARDIVDSMDMAGGLAATQAELAMLPAPPLSRGDGVPGAYRLPVAGRLLTGLGEVSASGVRSRGLTFAVAPAAAVVAPADGQVVFARAFRGYGIVVIIDHGSGWTTLVTGLALTGVRRGQAVTGGTTLGATGGGAPQVTVELRRRGRPVDLTALLGS